MPNAGQEPRAAGLLMLAWRMPKAGLGDRFRRQSSNVAAEHGAYRGSCVCESILLAAAANEAREDQSPAQANEGRMKLIPRRCAGTSDGHSRYGSGRCLLNPNS